MFLVIGWEQKQTKLQRVAGVVGSTNNMPMEYNAMADNFLRLAFGLKDNIYTKYLTDSNIEYADAGKVAYLVF